MLCEVNGISRVSLAQGIVHGVVLNNISRTSHVSYIIDVTLLDTKFQDIAYVIHDVNLLHTKHFRTMHVSYMT